MSIQDGSPDLEPVDQFVVPLYLELLNANFCRFTRQPADSRDKVEFEASFCRALDKISPDVVKHLLSDLGWRTQLTASWFCAVKDFRQFQNLIASGLMNDRSQYASQGYCIALYSFADAESISCLCQYLEHWLIVDEVNQQPAVMQTLLCLDAKLGSDHAAKYTSEGGLWQRWIRSRPDYCEPGIYSLIYGLDYLYKLDEMSEIAKLKLFQQWEKYYRHCFGCKARLEKAARHCRHCGRIEQTV